jgi:nucleoside-diphosphate-sugar epimerase
VKVLITGASGFVGRALCSHLVAHDFDVVGTVRSLPGTPVPGIDYRIVAEMGTSTDWYDALAGVQVIVHCAARVHVMCDHAHDPLTEFRYVNTLGTATLARAAARYGIKRLVFLSSIKVNGESTLPDVPFDQTSPTRPQDPYAISKWEAEQVLARVAAGTGLEVVVLRCPLVYGPGVKGNFLRLLQAANRGIPLPFALARNRRSLIYLDNLTGAIAICLTHPAAAGKTYLVSDGEDVSTAELISLIGQALGKSSRLWPCPLGLMKLAGLITGKSNEVARLLGSLCIDSSRIRNELGWAPPYTLAQGWTGSLRLIYLCGMFIAAEAAPTKAVVKLFARKCALLRDDEVGITSVGVPSGTKRRIIHSEYLSRLKPLLQEGGWFSRAYIAPEVAPTKVAGGYNSAS